MNKQTTASIVISPLAIFLFSTCMKINVEPPRVEGSPKPPAAGAPEVLVRVSGKRVNRDDWARARSMYRAFGSGVKNETGSLRKLMTPGLKGVVNQAGFRFKAYVENKAPATHSYLLRVTFKEADLIWQPPREFIQTPTARNRGFIQVNFNIHFELYGGAVFEPGAAKPLARHECLQKSQRRVLPGTQEEFMGTLGRRALTACLRDFQKALMAARVRP